MLNVRQSLASVIGAALFTLFTASAAQAQKAPPTPASVQVVNTEAEPVPASVVNNPAVRVSGLYPAQPFQRDLVAGGVGDCTVVPADRGLIIELVTVSTSSSSATGSAAHMVMRLDTTAGGVTAAHAIPLKREVITAHYTTLGVTQPLRVYADPGTQVCLRSLAFLGGPYPNIHATISGQLVPAAPSPANPAQ